MVKSKREFAEWLNKPAIAYKQGSKGEIKHEFKYLHEFLILECTARKEGLGMNNKTNNQLYKVMIGITKYFKSQYLGYKVSIKYIK